MLTAPGSSKLVCSDTAPRRTAAASQRLLRTLVCLFWERAKPLPPPSAQEAADPSKQSRHVRRLLKGRTLAVLQSLRRCSLFHHRDTDNLLSTEPLRPAAGLTAALDGQPVLILDVTRNGKAAVAAIVPTARKTFMRKTVRKATHVLSRRTAQRCAAASLQQVGVNFRLVGRVGDSLYLEQVHGDHLCGEAAAPPSTATDADAWGALEAAVQHTTHDAPQQPRPLPSLPEGAPVVLAAGAQQHLDQHPRHALYARQRECKPCFILDVPFPRQIDVRPRRCRTCNRRRGRAVTWTPGPADVLRMWPEVVHVRGKASMRRHLYLTPLFLLTCLQLLYTHLNAWAVRRSLVDVLQASALAAVRQGALPDPTQWASAVLAMKKRQAIYNLAGVRGDARYDLASRVRARNASTGHFENPYSAIQAWCGLDGSLLKPWVLCHGEAFDTQAEDLQPYLQFARDVRLAYGFTLDESRPVFHCTDSYNKRRNMWLPVYDAVWLGQTLHLQDGPGQKLSVSLTSDVKPHAATLVTGDPRHDCINLRRALSHLSYDFADAYHDHEDIMNRLSAPLRPAECDDTAADAASLSKAASEHLNDAITLRVLTWKQKWAPHPEVTDELKRFLQLPHLLDHPVWLRYHRAYRPEAFLLVWPGDSTYACVTHVGSGTLRPRRSSG